MNDYIREIARQEAWRVAKLVFAATAIGGVIGLFVHRLFE